MNVILFQIIMKSRKIFVINLVISTIFIYLINYRQAVAIVGIRYILWMLQESTTKSYFSSFTKLLLDW